jgi:hypothetical protein
MAWLLRGLPPLDHSLKRLPGDVMCGLLVPFLTPEPGPGPLYLRGGGAMAAYLGYGAETLGGLRVAGILDPAGTVWPPLECATEEPGASVWGVPGFTGNGQI